MVRARWLRDVPWQLKVHNYVIFSKPSNGSILILQMKNKLRRMVICLGSFGQDLQANLVFFPVYYI